MQKKLKLFVTLLTSLSFLEAATVVPSKPTYTAGETIQVTISEMEGLNEDWVGVYPAEANNDWENVLTWAWTGDVASREISLNGVAAGVYQVRAFYNNSFITEASANITVEALELQTTISTNKTTYDVGEEVVVSFTDMKAIEQDWIGVYPVGVNNDWGNVVAWAWTGDTRNGSVTFAGLPEGPYQVRSFFDNSFVMEASTNITVQGAVLNTTITTSKEEYEEGESIRVNFEDMLANDQDWIGIYPVGASNDWDNVVAWAWTGDTQNGHVLLNAVPVGEYEARGFFNNSFIVRASAPFSVVRGFIPPTIYEDAEDGTLNGWTSHGERSTLQNVEGGNASDRAIYAHVHWAGFRRLSSYALRLDNGANWHNTNQFILKVDQKTNGTACFSYGVALETTMGRRYMYFDAWFGRNGWDPARAVYENGSAKLTFALPERYRKRHGWETITQNLTERLQTLEPENNIISVSAFLCSGGDYYDNIRLESEE